MLLMMIYQHILSSKFRYLTLFRFLMVIIFYIILKIKGFLSFLLFFNTLLFFWHSVCLFIVVSALVFINYDVIDGYGDVYTRLI